MRLIIHAGFAKTGTTTLQSFLNTHRDELLNEKILYPLQFLHDGSAHHKIPMLIKAGKINRIHDLFSEIIGGFNDEEIVVFSSEEFSTLDVGQIELLFDISSSYFNEIEIVFTIRPHYSLFIGSFKQQIREAYIYKSLSEFWGVAKKHARFLHFEKNHHHWVQAANENNVIIKYLSTESNVPNYDGDIITQFLVSILNVEWNLPIRVQKEKKNVSLTSSQVDFIRNMYFHLDFLWKESVEWDHRRFVYFAFQHINKEFQKLSQLESSEFLATEILIAENSKAFFEEDWMFIYEQPTAFVPDLNSLKGWYDIKIQSLEKKLSSSYSQEVQYKKTMDIIDKDMLVELYEFYKDNLQLKQLGPSEQIQYYLKSKKRV